jgi:hypothetical protein
MPVTKGDPMLAFALSDAAWTVLALIYVVCICFLAVGCFAKGHYWLFGFGFLLPFLWLIGALIAPTPRAVERAALN